MFDKIKAVRDGVKCSADGCTAHGWMKEDIASWRDGEGITMSEVYDAIVKRYGWKYSKKTGWKCPAHKGGK